MKTNFYFVRHATAKYRVMDPEDTSKQYDRVASWWLGQMDGSSYGLAALERALQFVTTGGNALDVGCGCEGRFLRLLVERNFHCSGLDISEQMIAIAAERLPGVTFIRNDICSWQLPKKYELIVAWDSTFHLPLKNQEPVLRKLCDGLVEGGILLFSCGGGEQPGEIQGEFGGQRFEYSTLGIPEYLRVLSQSSCSIQHLEYDQFPENHVYIIAKKLCA